jgi:hypothetical protein
MRGGGSVIEQAYLRRLFEVKKHKLTSKILQKDVKKH